MTQNYPLQWPVGYPRTDRPARSLFKNPTLAKTVDNIYKEVARLKDVPIFRTEIVISSNVPLRNDGLPRADYFRSTIKDKGVAVYFKYNDKDVVMCCDKWDTVESNLHAVYLSIEALRSIDRWGVSDFIDRSFTGFKALPAWDGKYSQPHFWHVLGFDFMPSSTPAMWTEAQRLYRIKVKETHPDVGGDKEQFELVQRAYMEARHYFSNVIK